MRIVVVGASGNVGTAVLRRLTREPAIDAVTGVARRVPGESAGPPYEMVDWLSLDVGGLDAVDRLADCFTDAAAVIHLAWQIQPSHDRDRLRRTNVQGTAQVAEAAVRARVPALIVASSVGAYAPGPKDRRVGEDWPVTGVPGSTYSRDKADVEALLDRVRQRHPTLRIVRLRPGLTFQRTAASQIARFFAGPLAPLSLLRFGRLPAVPEGSRLRMQAVHADDVADAYVRAALSDVDGAFNIVAEPVLDARSVTARFGGVPIPVPPGLLRAGAAVTWYGRLQPVEPGWVELAARCPLLSAQRADAELGWRPRLNALDALAELFDGMAHRAGGATASLRRRPPASVRLAAVLAGRLPGQGDPY
ncbi:NAD-dependent epimerase/dehydratase family protein [Actinomycetes bacterium KLBMP 9797]